MGTEKVTWNRGKLICDKSQQTPQPIPWGGAGELEWPYRVVPNWSLRVGLYSLVPTIWVVTSGGSVTLSEVTFSGGQSLVKDATAGHQLPTPNNLGSECFGP